MKGLPEIKVIKILITGNSERTLLHADVGNELIGAINNLKAFRDCTWEIKGGGQGAEVIADGQKVVINLGSNTDTQGYEPLRTSFLVGAEVKEYDVLAKEV